MPPMPLAGHPPATWLSKLTIAQLRRAAFAIGARSSGTKAVLIQQIQQELGAPHSAAEQKTNHKHGAGYAQALSIVSMDMGIRNLAYAHLMAAPVSPRKGTGGSALSLDPRPSLLAWKRVVISDAPTGKGALAKRRKEPSHSDDVATLPLPAANGATEKGVHLELEKEAFDPTTFAKYAYKFIKSILSAHRPTHVLIERQRFRSGGGSAVQEWTIRVGVFEGMLHAVLQTLSEEGGLPVNIQAIDPGRVARYWLADRTAQRMERAGSAREGKRAKIDMVGESLGSGDGKLVSIGGGDDDGASQDVGQVVDAFLARWKKKAHNARKAGTQDIAKLDDLSDCLLQGVAWVNWQKKRQDVLQRGLGAFADDPVFESGRLPRAKSVPDKRHHARRKTRTGKTLGG